ncbi:MAG: hypothetical protein ACM3ML_10175 [Micromonosporaceae bacterium]
MLGTGTIRPQQDAPDRAADLVGYIRSGPRELPPGIPSGEPHRRLRRPIVPALACVAALAALLVGCQITKPKPTASPTASSGKPTPGATSAQPTQGHTSAAPTPRQSSSLPATPPSGALPALPATSGQLSVKVSDRVFAARSVHIRVVVLTPQAHTLRETLTGTISVARDGTLTGTAVATADRYNGVHVRAPLIFLPGKIYIAPPADLMPAGKTWVEITPDVPNGRASYSARQAAYVLYASATSWNLLRYAKDASRPHWQGSGAAATANMSGSVALATALPHTTPGAHDAVITFAGPGTKNATWRVTLDKRLLPRTCVINATSPVIGPITAYVTYSDWGADVHAAAPPASEVVTVDQLPDYLRQADP